MTFANNFTRANAALEQITALTLEKQTLLSQAWQAPLYERPTIKHRLQQIERELAQAQDERRRAQAGAPPAPPGYDPQKPQQRTESSSSNALRAPTWKHKVEAIRADYQGGEGLGKQALAAKYNLTPQQIGRVLGEEENRTHSTAKLNETQVRDILHRYHESNGRRGIIKELSEVFQVRKSTICDIIARRTWRNIEVDLPQPRTHTAGKPRTSGSEQVQPGGE
jgi:hypothetical protein